MISHDNGYSSARFSGCDITLYFSIYNIPLYIKIIHSYITMLLIGIILALCIADHMMLHIYLALAKVTCLSGAKVPSIARTKVPC